MFVGVVFSDARLIDGLADEPREHVELGVIDAAGNTLLPGLIDCHAHYTMDARLEAADGILDALHADPATAAFIGARNAALALNGGVTTARSAGAAHSRDIPLRDAIRAGH